MSQTRKRFTCLYGNRRRMTLCQNLIKKRTKELWFIALERVDGSHTWYWLSGSIARINGTSAGTWRWNKGEPNNFGKEKCGEMWQNGKYDNISCKARKYFKDSGYICEKQVSKFIIMPKLC